jgi:regulator of sigma E protease
VDEVLARAAPTDEARLEARRAAGRWYLGVAHRADVVTAPCELALAEAGAAPVKLAPGDRIVALWTEGGLWWSNESSFSITEFRGFLRQRGEEPFKLAWLPKGQTSKQTAVVKARKDGDRTWGDLGLVHAQRQVIVHRGPIAACVLGAHQTVVQTRRIFEMLRSFFTGGVSPGELGGPIMIVSTAYTIATGDSLAKLIHLLAILSVNLAVINILPIPVLDGGHILFLAIEKLRGKPVSGDIMWYAQWAGLLVILGLMVLVFFNDIRRLVS